MINNFLMKNECLKIVCYESNYTIGLLIWLQNFSTYKISNFIKNSFVNNKNHYSSITNIKNMMKFIVTNLNIIACVYKKSVYLLVFK